MIQTIEISDEQKDKILNLNENHFNDLKSKDIAPASLTKTISAFSNAVGGEVYIGIDEVVVNGNKAREWRGFTNEEEANGHIQIFERQTRRPPMVRQIAFYLSLLHLHNQLQSYF